MPNIFKRFLQPNASDFVFPDVEELVEEEPADTAGEQEGEPEESAPEAEEKDTPSAVDFAQIQAEKILEDVEVGVKKTDCPYEKIVDRREAIQKAVAMAEAGDVILIAGKGHETYQIFPDKTIHFDDIEEVRKAFGEDCL